MARPSALTPERRERIESALEDGIPIAIVAQNVGVGSAERLEERLLGVQ